MNRQDIKKLNEAAVQRPLFNEQRLDGLMAEFKKEIRWFNNEAFNTSQKFFYESLFDRILNEQNSDKQKALLHQFVDSFEKANQKFLTNTLARMHRLVNR